MSIASFFGTLPAQNILMNPMNCQNVQKTFDANFVDSFKDSMTLIELRRCNLVNLVGVNWVLLRHTSCGKNLFPNESHQGVIIVCVYQLKKCKTIVQIECQTKTTIIVTSPPYISNPDVKFLTSLRADGSICRLVQAAKKNKNSVLGSTKIHHS